jgi:hypothetical protein
MTATKPIPPRLQSLLDAGLAERKVKQDAEAAARQQAIADDWAALVSFIRNDLSLSGDPELLDLVSLDRPEWWEVNSTRFDVEIRAEGLRLITVGYERNMACEWIRIAGWYVGNADDCERVECCHDLPAALVAAYDPNPEDNDLPF